jgi:membrane protein
LLDWYEDRAQRLGAALAYYTIFALAPGLIIVMALAGMLLGPGAEQQILREVQELIGEQGATAIASVTNSPGKWLELLREINRRLSRALTASPR